ASVPRPDPFNVRVSVCATEYIRFGLTTWKVAGLGDKARPKALPPGDVTDWRPAVVPVSNKPLLVGSTQAWAVAVSRVVEFVKVATAAVDTFRGLPEGSV